MKEHKIPYGRQNITEEDINSVIEVLKSGTTCRKIRKGFC